MPTPQAHPWLEPLWVRLLIIVLLIAALTAEVLWLQDHLWLFLWGGALVYAIILRGTTGSRTGERLRAVFILGREAAHRLLQFRGQRRAGNGVARMQHRQAPDQIFQFADIARPAMAAQDFLFEESPSSFQAYAKLGSALRQFRFELGFQNLDFFRQRRDFGIHRKLPIAGSLKHLTRGVAFFVGFIAIKQHRLRRTVSSGKPLLLDLVSRKLHEILRKFGSVSRISKSLSATVLLGSKTRSSESQSPHILPNHHRVHRHCRA
jgi:hypothetical protein